MLRTYSIATGTSDLMSFEQIHLFPKTYICLCKGDDDLIRAYPHKYGKDASVIVRCDDRQVQERLIDEMGLLYI